MMQINIFTQIFDKFDTSVANTISHGSASIITLITPLMLTCFSIYFGLIALSYLNGSAEIPIGDTAKRMIGWITIIVFGLNIDTYSSTVVPFFNGFGDDIAQALTGSTSTANALDTLLNAYVDAIASLFKGISPWQVGLIIEAEVLATLIILSAVPFMAIAAAYIILAHFALGLLLALGPMFIAAAMFPATRRFFEAWIGQCISYGLLVALFAAVGAVEIDFAKSVIPSGGFSTEQYGSFLGGAMMMIVMGFVFIVISLNMPSLASQLAGGVGISSMVGKLASAAKGIGKLAQAAGKLGKSGGGRSGGAMTHEASGAA